MDDLLNNAWALAIAVGLPAAIIGYAFDRWKQIESERREARLKYLDNQLEKLYGPVFAFANANRIAWDSFCEVYEINDYFFDRESEFDHDKLTVWMHWMKTVFHPTNMQIRDTIVKNSHLIEGDEMPTTLVEFLAHVETYIAVISAWDEATLDRAMNGELEIQDFVSVTNYPDGFDEYVDTTYKMLKQRQFHLIQHQLVHVAE